MLLNDAQQAFQRQDYAAAVSDYQRVVQLRPGSAGALSNLGVAYNSAGCSAEAVETMQKALRLNPKLVPANLILGISNIKLGFPEKAIAPLEKVLEQDSANRDALLALASAHFSLQRFDLAVKAYRKEIKARPHDVDAWYGLAVCLEHEAEETTRHLASTNKDESPFRLRLVGEYLLEQGVWMDAEAAFRQALMAGENPGLHAGLGFVYLRSGEQSRAEREFATELRIHPTSLDGKLGTAAFAMEQESWMKGTTTLCEIAAADTGYFHAHLGFFLSLLTQATESKIVPGIGTVTIPQGCSSAITRLLKEIESPQLSEINETFVTKSWAPQAVRDTARSSLLLSRKALDAGHYGECAEKLPPLRFLSMSATLLSAQCNFYSGRYLHSLDAARAAAAMDAHSSEAVYWEAEASRKLAQLAFQKAVDLDPNSWQGKLLLGDIYRQRKNWQLASSYYRDAAKLKPDSPAPYLGLATIGWQTGQNQDAEDALKGALRLQPDNSLANFQLGDIYVREHRYEEAIPYLKKHLTSSAPLLTTHADLGKAYANTGHVEAAIQEIRLALPMDNSGDFYYQLFMLYKKQGQTELAKQAFEESERLRNENSRTQQQRIERVNERNEVSVSPQ